MRKTVEDSVEDLPKNVGITKYGIFGGPHERVYTLRFLMVEAEKKARLEKIKKGNIVRSLYNRLANFFWNTVSTEYRNIR